MANPRLDERLLREALEAVEKYGSITKASEALDIPRTTFQSRFDAAKRISEPPFIAPKLAEKSRSVDDLIQHRIAESRRARTYEDAASLIRVKLKTDGPIGLFCVGDPHLDNPGSDFELLHEHIKLAAERPEYVFAGNMGDNTDNWVGRLTRLYEHQTVSGREIWKLVEWLFKDSGVRWTWLIRGNHDDWSGKNDPLDWIASGAGVGVDRHWAARICFEHSNGTETRMHARHDFQGNSIFNPLHALKRETLHGHRDHILIAAHRHSGADARDINGDGVPFVMVRVSGYKISDQFAFEKGYHKRPLHPSALIVVDPDKDERSNERVWVAPTVEVGCDYLDFLRKRFESRPRVTPKRKR